MRSVAPRRVPPPARYRPRFLFGRKRHLRMIGPSAHCVLQVDLVLQYPRELFDEMGGCLVRQANGQFDSGVGIEAHKHDIQIGVVNLDGNRVGSNGSVHQGHKQIAALSGAAAVRCA